MLWSQKHKPKQLAEIIGHTAIIDRISSWADAWDAGQMPMPIFLHGSAGVGKTLAAETLAAERDWELFEMNASDQRDAKIIERLAGASSSCKTFSGKTRLVLLDEVDGIFQQDRGAASAIVSVIKNSKAPIILTANDFWDPKLSSIRQACEAIEMKKVHYALAATFLSGVAAKEGVEVSRSKLIELCKNCNGDVRAALNDLQLVAEGTKKISEEDIVVFGSRDREENIFNAVRTVLKSSSFEQSRRSVSDLDEEPDFILKWVEENLSKECVDPQEFYACFEKLSRASLFLGRIMKNQHYGFQKYALDLMSGGVAVSKRASSGFQKYDFPRTIRYYSRMKPHTAMRKKIAAVVAEQCHVSSSTAVQDYFPMFSELFKDNERAIKLAAQFELGEEELDFFSVVGAKTVAAEAEKLREEFLNQKVQHSADKNQKSLFAF